MCGRFTLTASWEELQKAFPDFDFELSHQSQFNITPSQKLLSITDSRPNQVKLLQWGLVPFWSKDTKIGQKLINARSETVTEKPSFRNAFKQRRCLILADGFYEWKKERDRKVPYYFKLKSESVFCFAGIWESWKQSNGEPLETCTILTTAANEIVSRVHVRMPVILSIADYANWISEENTTQQLQLLLKPYPANDMICYPVSTYINNPKNNSSLCIVPEQMPSF